MLKDFPEVAFRASEIAEYVGVDTSAIKKIEKEALKKIKELIWKQENDS